jgi:carbon monoxide dehydrogenase subunit G
MRLKTQIDISAPPAAIWEFATDPSRILHYFSGVTRWEVMSEQRRGLGARYRMLMRVGSVEIGSAIETIEFDEPHDWAWTSVTGLDQRGRLRLRQRDASAKHPRTTVELRLSYGVAGAGISGWLAEQLAAGQVRRHLQRSLLALKRQVEHEQLRADAAARRAARSAA